MKFIQKLAAKIKAAHRKMVFPEGEDLRILKAAVRLKNEALLQPILLGNHAKITQLLKQSHLSAAGLKIIQLDQYPQPAFKQMIKALVACRHGKTDHDQAVEWLKDPNYFGTMLVKMGLADGLVSGAAHSTAATVRPALQILRTKPGVHRVSGSFLLLKDDQQFLFADCAINLTLDAPEMCEVAEESAQMAKMFGMDPKIAMLSFSTKGSAKGPMVTKVQEATKLVHKENPDLKVDGEFQLDAAIVPEVAKTKAPDSQVAGHANVLIFPSLEAGNIGYKLTQRLGGYTALGPLLQGVAKPVSDLSRGCVAEDVYQVAIITALESIVPETK